MNSTLSKLTNDELKNLRKIFQDYFVLTGLAQDKNYNWNNEIGKYIISDTEFHKIFLRECNAREMEKDAKELYRQAQMEIENRKRTQQW